MLHRFCVGYKYYFYKNKKSDKLHCIAFVLANNF